ncbi:hypothetical protein [Sulfurimonas sp.]|uniref:hypothetical protein n=1 Tax=Sulfurimonas sp. TaxID=2022749 RepID=UPI002B493E88|nr:hypothetical protein [Sulfurimonas sp.]
MTGKMMKVYISFSLLLISFFISGCTGLKESLASTMEVPTLEKQINNASICIAIVRENNLILKNMEISSDATWPKKISEPISSEQKVKLTKLLMYDPYYATVRHTDVIQKIPPLAFSATNKLEILYGKDIQNWPKFFDSENYLGDFLEFKSGKLLDIEVIQGDIYQNISKAIISLAPINLQKDLFFSEYEMQGAFSEVVNLKAREGELKNPLFESQEIPTKKELKLIKIELKNAEVKANEKEKIYFTLLDGAIIALEKEIDLEEKNYIDLAININLVAQEVQRSSIDAYASFGITLRKIQVNNMFKNFNTELDSLAKAKLFVPRALQEKYNQRVARLMKNSIYFLPNIFMGTYYAHKQAKLAQKYIEFTNIIIEAYALK